MDQIKIGKFIQTTRKEINLTQKDLADQIGVSDKTISKWETGNGLPDLDSMNQLCQILQVSVNELISGERLTPMNYSKKAEENMMNLMNENESSKKVGKIQIVLGVVLGILAILLIFGSVMGFAGVNHVIDIVSLVEMLLLVFAVLLASGAKNAAGRIDVIMKALFPAALIIVFLSLIAIFTKLSDSDAEILIVNLAVAIIPIFYAGVAYLILLPIRHRLMQKFR